MNGSYSHNTLISTLFTVTEYTNNIENFWKNIGSFNQNVLKKEFHT